MKHPPRMRITGQLLFDSHHATGDDPGGGRGKQGHKAFWEIHPVFQSEFLDPVDPNRPVGIRERRIGHIEEGEMP